VRFTSSVATIAAPIALLLLAACGSGDGGKSASPTPTPTPAPTPTPTPTPTPVNGAPAFTSANVVSVIENAADFVYQAVATDPEGSPIAYWISGGADADKFTLNGTGQLRLVTSPNFDLPTDADGDNAYLVQLSASDGLASGTIALRVTVTNSKEGIAVRRIATGFDHPVAIAPLSATRMLVVERSGAIYDLNPQTGERKLFYQVAHVGSGDRGVIAFVVSRNFETGGAFYVMFTSTLGGMVVQRYFGPAAGPPTPDAYGLVMGSSAPQYRGGGWLGYDGVNLIIATGDAGGSDDQASSAQDPSSKLGKILRVTDNPFPFASGSPNFFLITTIATGLRNPNGASLYGGGLLIADSGQDVAEEVDFLPFGAATVNFGWPFKEGTETVRGTPPANVTDPVIEYPHTGGTRTGQAIVGGFVGSSAVATLSGYYVFADRNGSIFTIPAAPLRGAGTVAGALLERRTQDFVPDQGTIDRPASFGVDGDGRGYIVDDDGDIFRVDQG
jgi:glucose/arabinose dehydrogenase